MVPKFHGKKGKRKLASILKEQKLINGNEVIADKISKISKIFESPSNKKVIEQGDDDTNILFIISGSVSILVNKREVAVRQAGNHVGEMALINPSEKRSGTVKTREKTIFVQVSEDGRKGSGLHFTL
jgi:CRP/FNR family transcriptional regulator, cyclic AMP receptor protein